MPGDRLTVAVVAELREFERKLALMPEIGGAEAKKLAGQIRKELKNAEDDSKNSASKIGKALGGVTDVIEKGLKKLGPIGGEVADVLFDFAGPLAETAMGVGEVTSGLGAAGMAATVAGAAVLGIGAAIAAAAVGGGILVAGMAAVVNAAGEAVDRLDAMGMAARVPEEARAALDQYQGATARLWAEVDVLTTQLGAALAPVLTALADKVGDLIEWVNNLDKSFDALRARIDGVLDLLPEWVQWAPQVMLVRGAVDLLESSYDALVETAQSADLAPTQDQIDAWNKASDERKRIASEDAQRQRDATIAAIELELEYNQTIAELQQWLVDHEQELADAQWANKVAAYNAEVEAHERAQGLMLDATIARRTKEQQAADKARQKNREELQSALDSIGKIADATQSLATLVVDSYQARADAGEDLSIREERAANRAFRIAQAAAVTKIGIGLAEAFAGFLAAYSSLGPFALLAAGAEVAVAAAAIAPILGEKPPFPSAHSPNMETLEGRGSTTVGLEHVANGDDPSFGGGKDEQAITVGQRSSKSSSPEVTVSVTFTDGRIGKRRVS